MRGVWGDKRPPDPRNLADAEAWTSPGGEGYDRNRTPPAIEAAGRRAPNLRGPFLLHGYDDTNEWARRYTTERTSDCG